MKLRVISDFGAIEQVVTDAATAEIVRETMASLDWKGFHQVIRLIAQLCRRAVRSSSAII